LIFKEGDGRMKSEVSAMLLQFRVKNYRSIGDEMVIDLTAGKGREHGDSLIVEKGVKVLPVISLYGNNASGKSTIINAMTSMFLNMAFSYVNGDRDYLRIVPFLYNDQLKGAPTEVEIFFALNGKEYQYGYIATMNKIHEEWLYQRTLSVKDTKAVLIFEREDDDIKFAESSLNILGDSIDQNNLVLSFLGNRHQKRPIKGLKIFADIIRWTKNNLFHGDAFSSDEAVYAFYNEVDDGGIKNGLIDFLKDFDQCIEDITWELEIDVDGKKIHKMFSWHNGVKYPFEIESNGTQSLLRIYHIVFIALNMHRSTIIYDELEAHLHPLILRRIVRMFQDKEVNLMGSQLIFTTHNLIMLDNQEMRRDQVWFVEKDERGFTSAFSLDSFKPTKGEVRSDMNYSKNYLAGRFGAIPYADTKEE